MSLNSAPCGTFSACCTGQLPCHRGRRSISWREAPKPTAPRAPAGSQRMTGTTHAGEARTYGLKSNIQTLFGDNKDGDFKTEAHYHTRNRLTSPLLPGRHVDSVGCDQLCIRHLCTELELLEPSLSFCLGEKRQQVLASQPVVQIIQIRSKRDGSAEAQVVGFSPGLVGNLGKIVLA